MSKPSTKPKPKTTKGIDTFFNKKPDVITHVESSKDVVEDCVSSEKTTIPIVDEFQKSLSESERIAHELAEKMLGTSYDVMRTHGFLAWQKSKKS